MRNIVADGNLDAADAMYPQFGVKSKRPPKKLQAYSLQVHTRVVAATRLLHTEIFLAILSRIDRLDRLDRHLLQKRTFAPLSISVTVKNLVGANRFAVSVLTAVWHRKEKQIAPDGKEKRQVVSKKITRSIKRSRVDSFINFRVFDDFPRL